ncbi:hypothetical protein EB118_07185 [bacterium]|nr:hypothetical protein [bacterium]
MRITNPEFTKTILGIESINQIIILITLYNPNDTTQVIGRLADGIGIDKVNTGDPTTWKPLRLGGTVQLGTPSTSDDITYDTFTTTDDDIVYGVVSRGENYIYIPMQITLPDESDGSAPRATITFYNITGHLTPFIRTINNPLPIKLEVIVAEYPDEVEVSFSDLYLMAVTYNKEQILAEITILGVDREPFPQHNFTPLYFPGLF